MSDFTHKPDSGSVFRNQKKKEDKHPDYQGTALIDDTEYKLAGWISETKNGQTFLSLKFAKKEQDHPAPQQPPSGLGF